MTLDGLLKSLLHVYSLWRIKAVATEPLRLREHDIRIKHDIASYSLTTPFTRCNNAR